MLSASPVLEREGLAALVSTEPATSVARSLSAAAASAVIAEDGGL